MSDLATATGDEKNEITSAALPLTFPILGLSLFKVLYEDGVLRAAAKYRRMTRT